MASLAERTTRVIAWPSLRLQGPRDLLLGRFAVAASFAFILFVTTGF
ncbi:hypothetical protein [Rhizobium oryzicola]|uniref:ABC transporter permease n=1 Tax=Rhizobium oryzicola TaxID=1232668 RepID=A0ABT8T0R8_9HYPH|nr:hypothetical protein [Rhizobium oryzicola]MDO1583806.1 hypothetical protein [Rhizobium oryzicola]